MLRCKLLPFVGQNASRSMLWNPTSLGSLSWASFIQSTYPFRTLFACNYLNFRTTVIAMLFTHCVIQNIHFFPQNRFLDFVYPSEQRIDFFPRLFKNFSLYRSRCILPWDVNITVFSRTNYGALGSTQPLTEMITRNISWGVGRQVRRVDRLTEFTHRLSRNLRSSASWKTLSL